MCDKTILISLRDNDPVYAVNAIIEEKESIPVSCQSLTYSGKVMQPGRLLSDYSIDNNATINLNLRLLGGMPGSSKSKKRDNRRPNIRREVRQTTYEDHLKSDGEEYGWVLRHLGNRRVSIQCEDGITRQCLIRYKPAKFGRQYISAGNLVLIAVREFSERTGDVLHRFSDEDSKKLIALGQVRKPPSSEFDDLLSSDQNTDEVEDDNFDFVFEAL